MTCKNHNMKRFILRGLGFAEALFNSADNFGDQFCFYPEISE